MSYFESFFRFLGWWVINIEMLLTVFLVLGTGLHFLKHIPRGKTLMSIGLGGFIILSCLPLGLWTLTWLENRFPEPQTLPPQAKGIILLGGSFDLQISKERKEPAYNLAAGRMIRFIELAKKYPHLERVFTGTSLEVALVKKEFAALGLDQGSVLFEDKALNTSSNATNTAKLLSPSPKDTWVLVTTAYHMPRAVGLFRKAGFSLIPYPVDYRTSGHYTFWPLIGLRRNLNAWYIGIREVIGILGNYLVGRSDTLLPYP